MVIFRENTEDVYCGIEFKSGSDKAKKVLALLKDMGYSEVYNLGAFKDWAENGGAVEPAA